MNYHPVPSALALALLLASTAIPLSAHAVEAEVIRLASDEWCPYVCARDGKLEDGFVFDVVTRALASMGLRVDARLLPLNRAMQQTVSGTLDGVFAPPEDSRLSPSRAIAYSRSCFYTSSKSTWSYRGVGSLNQVRLGAIGDYEYDNGEADAYIQAHSANRKVLDLSYGANAGSINVKKLLGGRFDVLIEHELVMSRLIADLKSSSELRNAGCLERAFALRVGFAPNNPRSPVWAAALSKGTEKLEKSGELAQIRTRYGVRIDQASGAGTKTQP